MGAYINTNEPQRNAYGFHAYDPRDLLYGFASCHLDSTEYDSGCALAMAAAFRLITHLHTMDNMIRTFQLVHNCPRVARVVTASILPPGCDESLITAYALYHALPLSVWVVWDGGRRRKSSDHIQSLQKRLKSR